MDITLRNVDPRALHQQILQVEGMLAHISPPDHPEAGTLRATLNLLHQIEETIRAQARFEHHHPLMH